MLEVQILIQNFLVIFVFFGLGTVLNCQEWMDRRISQNGFRFYPPPILHSDLFAIIMKQVKHYTFDEGTSNGRTVQIDQSLETFFPTIDGRICCKIIMANFILTQFFNWTNCNCGENEQTVEHILFKCPLYWYERYKLSLFLNKDNIEY